MKLLADENIPDALVEILRTQGFDVAKVTPGSKDPAVALKAKRERRVLITQDKDFGNILAYPPRQFHGIIRLKFHPPVIDDIVPALESLFKKFPARALDKRLFIVEKNGFRVR